MAITSSAKKEIRASSNKHTYNLRRLRTMRGTIKTLHQSRENGCKTDEITKNLQLAQKAIDKATKRGVIKKNTASRRKARLVRAVKNTANLTK